MKRNYNLLLSGFIVILLSSCIKDEPLYRETDIQSFRIEGEYYISTPSISQNAITVLVSNGADISLLTPVIELPEGATVQPASGVTQDFSGGPVTYTVTAQNPEYTRTYAVSVIKPATMPLKFDFEMWEKTASGYHDLLVYSGTELVKLWSSGNSGVAILNATTFPTRPSEDELPYSGNYAAKLETRYGGVDWGSLKIPIFSGSLFYGKFTANMADPRKSLILGHLHFKESGKPTVFTGYYNYTPGSPFVYLENGVEVRTTGITDAFSMYSLVFRVKKGDPDNEYLDGIKVADDERIIARAEWRKENAPTTDHEAERGYTRFSIPFEYKEEMDYNLYDYKLVILFASSKEGNLYRGALGSTFLIDDVEIVCEQFED